MCYSPGMSFLLGCMGLIMAYFLTRIQSPSLRNVYLFYTLMEFTQFIQYQYLDQCHTWQNQYLTYFIHLLVIVQPYLWNWYRLNTSSHNKDYFRFACVLSILWAIFYTARLYPNNLSTGGITYKTLNLNETMVGEQACSYQGPVHLYWNLPYQSLNGFEPNFYSYLILFIFPSIYEKYGPIKLVYWVAQLLFTSRTCGVIHELPTIWCAISIPILLFTFCLDVLI